MSDPQFCRGGQEALASVKLWMTPCACGHEMLLHELTTKGKRSWCSFATAKGRCGCVLYSAGEAI